MVTWATLPGSKAGAHGFGSFWLRLARLVGAGQRRPYVLFVLPAMAIIAAVIIFPWFFTLFMSVHDWKITQSRSFVGLDNYAQLFGDERFQWALLRTLYYTLLAVLAPLILGTLAALVFHRKFPLRGFLRGVFILPMMATPVAVALVWTMMFHPQLGVLNYLLSLVGIPPQLWVFDPGTVIPSLVLVETWQWTPLVMLIVLGGLAALVFHRKFPLRGFLRGVFILPMMATPVAVALVWTMMFHPQLGVLNYLLSLVGIPPQLWVFDPGTVIPSLVLVETWQWTPLVMLIVLGGLAALPTEPYEAAQLDGASAWQTFWRITFPMVLPFLMVAAIIRTIDAVKAFDIIYVISQGGPGTASETLNIFLYLQAFAFYNIGYASAVVVVFFALIIALSLVLLYVRQRSKWSP